MDVNFNVLKGNVKIIMEGMAEKQVHHNETECNLLSPLIKWKSMRAQPINDHYPLLKYHHT